MACGEPCCLSDWELLNVSHRYTGVEQSLPGNLMANSTCPALADEAIFGEAESEFVEPIAPKKPNQRRSLSGIFGSVAIPSGTQEKLPPCLCEGSARIWLKARDGARRKRQFDQS
jgi:hypothetical protein